MEPDSSSKKKLQPERLFWTTDDFGEYFLSTEMSTTKNSSKIRRLTMKPFGCEDVSITGQRSIDKKPLAPTRIIIGQKEIEGYIEEEIANAQKKTVKKVRKELFDDKKQKNLKRNTVSIKKNFEKQTKLIRYDKQHLYNNKNDCTAQFEVKKIKYKPVPSNSETDTNLNNSSDLEFTTIEKQYKIEEDAISITDNPVMYEKICNIFDKQMNMLNNLKKKHHSLLLDIEEYKLEYLKGQVEILKLFEGNQSFDLSSRRHKRNVAFNFAITEETNGADKENATCLYDSLRKKYKSLLCTPKSNKKTKVDTPASVKRRKQLISNKVHGQCLLLQDTPLKG